MRIETKLRTPPPFAKKQEAPIVEKPAMAATEAPESKEHEAGEAAVPPEAVCFRDEGETCGNCRFMGAQGECSRLMMPVSAGAGCNLFAMREDGASDIEEPRQ